MGCGTSSPPYSTRTPPASYKAATAKAPPLKTGLTVGASHPSHVKAVRIVEGESEATKTLLEVQQEPQIFSERKSAKGQRPKASVEVQQKSQDVCGSSMQANKVQQEPQIFSERKSAKGQKPRASVEVQQKSQAVSANSMQVPQAFSETKSAKGQRAPKEVQQKPQDVCGSSVQAGETTFVSSSRLSGQHGTDIMLIQTRSCEGIRVQVLPGRALTYDRLEYYKAGDFGSVTQMQGFSNERAMVQITWDRTQRTSCMAMKKFHEYFMVVPEADKLDDNRSGGADLESRASRTKNKSVPPASI
jgi:hypothetical protein